MIHIEELRVGNYYFLDNEIIKLDGGTLIAVIQNEVKLNPIPLTEELLVKYGFYQDGKKDYYYIRLNDITQYFELWQNADDTDNLYVGYLTNDDIETHKNIESIFLYHFNFVHELQNLYRSITKTNLTINL